MSVHCAKFRRYRLHVFVITILVFISAIQVGYSQKKLTDSLLQKKTAFEKRPGFVETDTAYLKILYKVARSYIYQSLDSTKLISQKVIDLSETVGFEKGIAGGKLCLAMYNFLNANFEKGHIYADESILLSKKVKDDSTFLRGINAKSIAHFMTGDYPKVYLECKRGELHAKKVNNHIMHITFIMNLATCFNLLKDYEQALLYYKDALNLIEDSDDRMQKAQIYVNMGYLYLNSKEYEKAKIYCEKALPVFEENQFMSWLSFTYTTLAEVALKEGKINDAIAFFKKSEDRLELINDQQRQVEALQGLADAYFQLKEFEKSMGYAQRAETSAKEMAYHSGLMKSSELLYKLSSNKGDAVNALKYLTTARRLSDSIFKSENRTRFLMLEAQAKFDREMKVLDFENERKLAKQKTLTYISAIVILALLVIAFLIRKNGLNQKKTNKALQEINHTKDKLFSIIGHDLKSPIGTLQELLALYTSDEISEKDIAKMAPRLKRNVDNSSFTLNNLLYWAKTQMNGVKANKRPVLIKKTATGIVELFQSRILDKKIVINCSIDPSLEVQVDPMHIDIILRNIISNAIKFTPDNGKINFDAVEKGEFIEISICDSGIGMTAETMKHLQTSNIVEPKTGTHKEKGTGLGLQISRELIEINHGNLKIESQIGQGSCFFISLPFTANSVI